MLTNDRSFRKIAFAVGVLLLPAVIAGTVLDVTADQLWRAISVPVAYLALWSLLLSHASVVQKQIGLLAFTLGWGALALIPGTCPRYPFAFYGLGVVAISLALYQRSARQDLEQELAKARAVQQGTDELLRHMSHQFRTPLNAIMGHAQLLQAEAESTSDRSALAGILQSGDDLLRLLTNILDATKRQISISPEPMNLGLLVDRLASQYGLVAAGKRLDFRVATTGIDASQITVLGDWEALHRVVGNMLDNAAKFTEQGFIRLGVDVRDAGDHVRVTFAVVDTGVGIEESSLPTLFEPFTRGQEYHTASGAGLGLHVAARLTRLMNGKLSVESRLHQGSTFTLTVELPRTDEIPATIRPDTMQHPVGYKRPSEAPITILIVDDDPMSRRVLTAPLNRMGFTVVEAVDGAEAVEQAQACSPGMILMDILMPRLTGVEAAQRIREQGYNGPIIALSASEVRQHGRFELPGFDAILMKPVDFARLYGEMARLGIQWIFDLRETAPVAEGSGKSALPDEFRSQLVVKLQRFFDIGDITAIEDVCDELEKAGLGRLAVQLRALAYSTGAGANLDQIL